MTISISLKNRIGEIERAVSENIHFNAGENADSADLFVCFADLLNVGQSAGVVQAIGESQVLGVVGDCHVFVAERAGRFGHLFDGVAAVGLDRVHVDVAADVLLGD